jgi:TonB family protein
MLEQLIESKNNTKENTTRGGFILTTFLLVATLCFSAVLSSLFAMNLGMGGEDLELSSLVMPIAPVEPKPEPVEPVRKQENQSEKIVTETTREANILRLDENPITPNQISNEPLTQKARPNAPFMIKSGIERDASERGAINRESNGDGDELGKTGESKVIENKEKEEEPVLTKKVVVEPKKETILRSGAIINSKATYLPKPVYPQAAIAIRAGGAVNVQVMLDESGKVVSAKAVSGHPLLRAAAENAARNAKFTPTILTGKPVKVTGVIIYNFTRN